MKVKQICTFCFLGFKYSFDFAFWVANTHSTAFFIGQKKANKKPPINRKILLTM
jgi:hypothetical protein